MTPTADPPADGRSASAWAWLLVAMIAVPTIVVPSIGGLGLTWRHGEMMSILLLASALVAARRWPVLRELRPFITVWIAYLIASVAMWTLLDAVGYIAWTERTPKYRWATISVLVISVPALAMLGAARALGFTRSELNLASGDMHATGRLPWTSRSARWTRLGFCSVAVTLVVGVVWIWSAERGAGLGLLVTWLPAGLIFAAVNASQEELRFRLVPLATLVPAVGAERAIWMTSAVFGLAHWIGANPSGPLGSLFNVMIGAWLAKSILDTRGVAWAWIMHALGDFVLFVVLVLNAT